MFPSNRTSTSALHSRTRKRFSIPFIAVAMVLLCAAFAPASRAQQPSFFGFGPHHKVDLSKVVFVGDSLTAGFQSDSLIDTAQPHGWANLVAVQAGTPLSLPLIAPPGIPPTLELVSPGPPPIIITAPGESTGRDNPFLQATDLGVPGALLNDALVTKPTLPASASNILTDVILGEPGLAEGLDLTQVQWAQTLKPTTVFVWIGNNDILGAAAAADPSLATPIGTFHTEFKQLLDQLALTHATIVVSNIPDVTAIPLFTSTDTIAREAGLPVFVIEELLGIHDGDLVTPEGVALVPGILADPSTGPLPATDVLTFKQVIQTKLIVDAYNAIIGFEVFVHGDTLVDIHTLSVRTAEFGIEANGHHLTNAFLGGLFSLDGVHPTNTGYAVIANAFIQTLDQQLGAHVPLISIDEVAKTDPLIFASVTSGREGHVDAHVDAKTAASMKATILRPGPH
jgi:lysophospholipase L1-like esterase